MFVSRKTPIVTRGVVYVKPLSAYLRQLQAIERQKPEKERKHVPTLTELSKIIGVNVNTLSLLPRAKSVKLSLASAILTQMRQLGFPMELSDLLGFDPPIFSNSEKPKEQSPIPLDIKALTNEYLKADAERRQAMRDAMPPVVTMIERYIEQQVLRATSDNSA